MRGNVIYAMVLVWNKILCDKRVLNWADGFIFGGVGLADFLFRLIFGCRIKFGGGGQIGRFTGLVTMCGLPVQPTSQRTLRVDRWSCSLVRRISSRACRVLLLLLLLSAVIARQHVLASTPRYCYNISICVSNACMLRNDRQTFPPFGRAVSLVFPHYL